MLFFVSLGVYITTLAVNEGSTNSAVFNVKEKYRNPHSVFHKSSDHQTLLSCGHACLRNPRCKATNFRSGENGQHRAVCELLDGPLTELHNALEFDKDWVFSHSMEVNLVKGYDRTCIVCTFEFKIVCTLVSLSKGKLDA